MSAAIAPTRDRLLADVEVEEAADLPLRVGLGRLLLEAAEETHAKNIARCGGSTLCGGSCGSRCRAGRASSVSVPIGLSLYLKEEQARKLKLPYQSRSALAREIVDFVAAQLPDAPDSRAGRWRLCHQGLPATVTGHGPRGRAHAHHRQALCAARLSRAGPRRGCPPKKGPLLGSPKTLARKRSGWQPHPTEAGALVQAWDGAVAYRPAGTLDPRGGGPPSHAATAPPAQASANRRPPVEAFFTTDLTLSLEAILAQYRERWAVEITIRDSNAFAGFGQDQCRKRERVVGANTLRLVLAAARTLWFVEQTSRADTLDSAALSPLVSPEVRPQPTRHRLGLPRSVARSRSFSHTTVRPRACGGQVPRFL